MYIEGVDDLLAIASGASSVVYRGRDVRHDRDVAVKVLHVSLAGDEKDRWRREVDALARLGGHPHVVSLIASGFTESGQPYLVTPFYADGTWADLVARGGLSAEEVAELGRGVAQALAAMHASGVIHRDIKPANVFVAPFGTGGVVGDFGIATNADPHRTITENPALTVAYAAPEVLESGRGSATADVYSLGATLWSLLEGRAPYAGNGPAAVIRSVTQATGPPPFTRSVPDSLAELIASMMAIDPDERPSAAHVGALLGSPLGIATSHVGAEADDVATPPSAVGRGWLGWLAVGMAASLAFGVVIWWVAAAGTLGDRTPDRKADLQSGNQPDNQSAGHVDIYADALASGFRQAPYVKDPKESDLASTSPVHSGKRAIRITEATDWSGLALDIPDGLRLSDQGSLRLWVWAPEDLPAGEFYLGLVTADATSPGGLAAYRTESEMPARTWTPLIIPMEQLRGTGATAATFDEAIGRMLWLGRTSSGTLVVDDLRLTG